jgi:hypothetical protein
MTPAPPKMPLELWILLILGLAMIAAVYLDGF